MLLPFVRDYTLTAITGTPDVLERLLDGIASTDSVWDRRPDPERFTLREIAAHLADWNGVWQERITRIRDEEEPRLVVRRPDDVGRESGSFLAAPADSLLRFRASRAELLPILRSLEGAQWERAGEIIGHPSASGMVSIESWLLVILGHDGYHLRQIAEWLKASQKNK